jgi:hypothetical protein
LFTLGNCLAGGKTVARWIHFIARNGSPVAVNMDQYSVIWPVKLPDGGEGIEIHSHENPDSPPITVRGNFENFIFCLEAVTFKP